MVDDKECRVCEQTLPVDDFAPRPTCADGRDTVCRSCDATARRLRRRAKSGHARRSTNGSAERSPASRFEVEADCADCAAELSRNRRILVDGEAVCSSCWRKRFGVR